MNYCKAIFERYKDKVRYWLTFNEINCMGGKTMYGKKIENDGDFAALFLEKALVATVPCTSFAAPNYLRWSYATSMENIDKGLDRLEKFIAEA